MNEEQKYEVLHSESATTQHLIWFRAHQFLILVYAEHGTVINFEAEDNVWQALIAMLAAKRILVADQD